MIIERIVLVASVVASTLVPQVAMATAYWSPYFSEESSPPFAWCSATGREGISGVRCQGSYCDNVGIRCETLPYATAVVGHSWEHTISDPDGILLGFDPNSTWVGSHEYGHVCGAGTGVLTGIYCDDSYCDNLTLECATAMVDVDGVLEPLVPTDCIWEGPYSEEDPWFAYGVGSNRFITGMLCAGSYCDDKIYRVCSLPPPPNSCEGRCGTKAPSNCWCDSACSVYGDCCDDYTAMC